MIATGHVYRIGTRMVDPPKTKIVVCVGDWFFIWFNSEPRQRPGQMPVSVAEAPGITKDCYLDCGRVTTFPPRELADAEDQGACTRDFLLRIIDEVENRGRTLVSLHRSTVIRNLQELVDSMPLER